MANDRFSIFKVISEALGGHKGWQPMWREPEPKPDPQSVSEAEAEAQEPTEVHRVPQSPSGVPQ